MSIREQISARAAAKLEFLPEMYDSALVGYVERGTKGSRHVVACYAYQAMKAVLLRTKKMDALSVFATLKKELSDYRCAYRPVILKKVRQDQLRELIRSKKYVTIQMMNRAIKGIAYSNCEYNGFVYDKEQCIQILKANQSTGNNSDEEDYRQAAFTVENDLVSMHCGRYTPWFLTYIKQS
jgi:hypothetical protein